MTSAIMIDSERQCVSAMRGKALVAFLLISGVTATDVEKYYIDGGGLIGNRKEDDKNRSASRTDQNHVISPANIGQVTMSGTQRQVVILWERHAQSQNNDWKSKWLGFINNGNPSLTKVGRQRVGDRTRDMHWYICMIKEAGKSFDKLSIPDGRLGDVTTNDEFDVLKYCNSDLINLKNYKADAIKVSSLNRTWESAFMQKSIWPGQPGERRHKADIVHELKEEMTGSYKTVLGHVTWSGDVGNMPHRSEEAYFKKLAEFVKKDIRTETDVTKQYEVLKGIADKIPKPANKSIFKNGFCDSQRSFVSVDDFENKLKENNNKAIKTDVFKLFDVPDKTLQTALEKYVESLTSLPDDGWKERSCSRRRGQTQRLGFGSRQPIHREIPSKKKHVLPKKKSRSHSWSSYSAIPAGRKPISPSWVRST